MVHVKWDSVATPRLDAAAIRAALAAAPVAAYDTTGLDLTWYTPRRKEIPQSRVLTSATTTITLPPGSYIVRSIADDAVRVFIDGALVIDDWAVPGESRVREATFVATGTHSVRVEHLQIEGWYELRVDVVPAR